MYSVILCGGSGTRLWPLSRKNYPKQFLNLYSNRSLLQETYLRMKELMPPEKIFFSTNKENYFNVLNQVKELDNHVDEGQVIIEPASRNTGPAIAYALRYFGEMKKIDRKDPVIFLPADHYIGNKAAYLETMEKAVEQVNGFIGTIGIKPGKPAETGYGYIRKGQRQNGYFLVSEFKEKPDEERAAQYTGSGEYLWNSGIYFFNTETFERELQLHDPKLYGLYSKKFEDFSENFEKAENTAFDIAISEKSKNVVVFEGDFDWSDIGSFDSMAEIDTEKKRRHLSVDSKNIYVYSTNNRLITTLGVEDLIIVESSDTILVQKKGKSEKIKSIVQFLEKEKIKEIEHHTIVHRPWGKYEVLIDGKNHKVKKITVHPGEKLSRQAHYHRAEHWIVIKGTAKIVNGDDIVHLRENESTYIPTFTVHRLENPGKISLELIEVQTGNYLEEDDIIRHADDYNRAE